MSVIRFDEDRRVLVVGDRTFPAERGGWDDLPGFTTRQVLVRCENAWSISVIWGSGTYSDNRHAFGTDAAFVEGPTQVECGVLNRAGDLVGDVYGWQSAPDVCELVDRISRLPSEEVARAT